MWYFLLSTSHRVGLVNAVVSPSLSKYKRGHVITTRRFGRMTSSSRVATKNSYRSVCISLISRCYRNQKLLPQCLHITYQPLVPQPKTLTAVFAYHLSAVATARFGKSTECSSCRRGSCHVQLVKDKHDNEISLLCLIYFQFGRKNAFQGSP